MTLLESMYKWGMEHWDKIDELYGEQQKGF
ncbi:hypothetical protein MZM54_23120 [[Brevibacterium] frigoritolerans]|nr:hypothetical protein [Peribacillus frigoritolerans]